MKSSGSLRDCRVKELAKMARQRGVRGWHSMRKEQLVRALLSATRKVSANGNKAEVNGHQNGKPSADGTGSSRGTSGPPGKADSPEAARRIAQVRQYQQSWKDLSVQGNGAKGKSTRDRLVVMVRDSFWLHAYWEVTQATVERAKAAMGHLWHLARPVIRVYQVEQGHVAVDADRWVRDVDIHGGVNNWYVDVLDPPKNYRLDIGYLAEDKYFSIARSNIVRTPAFGASDELDQNWAAVAEDSQRIYARSAGHGPEDAFSELREILEERLRRPMGSPSFARFGAGAELLMDRRGDFEFQVDAEMIVFGSTRPDAYVTMQGEPVRLRPDGSFTLRMSMPDRRQVIPIVASSPDGVEQRTIVLAVERNTKVMEPIFKDPDD